MRETGGGMPPQQGSSLMTGGGLPPQAGNKMMMASSPSQTGGGLPPSQVPRYTGGPNPPQRDPSGGRLLQQAFGGNPQGRAPMPPPMQGPALNSGYTPPQGGYTPPGGSSYVTPNPYGIPPGYNNGGYVPFPGGMPGGGRTPGGRPPIPTVQPRPPGTQPA